MLTLTERDRYKIKQFQTKAGSIKAITPTGKHRVLACTDDGTLTLGNDTTIAVSEVSLPPLADKAMRELHHEFRKAADMAQCHGDYTEAIAQWDIAQSNFTAIEIAQITHTEPDFWSAIASGTFADLIPPPADQPEPEPQPEPPPAAIAPEVQEWLDFFEKGLAEPWYVAWLMSAVPADLQESVTAALPADRAIALAAHQDPPDFTPQMSEWLLYLRHAATANNPSGTWHIPTLLSAIGADPHVTPDRRVQIWQQLTPDQQTYLRSGKMCQTISTNTHHT